MSKYTTEVRFLCESLTGHNKSEDYSSIDEIIEDALPIIFSFDYPIFDENYREVLETKILRHYYTREIGSETYGLWKLRLQTKLNEIMPYYNKLYESELLKYDPLRDVDMTTTNVGQKTGERSGESNDNRVNSFNGTRQGEHEQTNVGSSNSQGGSSDTTQDLYSDTPQGGLTGVDNLTYLTNARKISNAGTNSNATDTSDVSKGKNKVEDSNTESSTGKNSSAEKTNSTEGYVMHVFGKAAGHTYTKMLKEFRDNLLNIDMDIIRDLADLFMLIW